MRRGRALLVGGALALLAGPALAQDEAPLFAKADGCLRANVDRVVADEPDLRSAAAFLVSFVCAKEVADAGRYERNLVMAQFLSTAANTFPQVAPPGQPPPAKINVTISVDPQTGELVIPKDLPAGSAFLVAFAPSVTNAQSTLNMTDPVPVSLRVFAGRLVMESYERRAQRR